MEFYSVGPYIEQDWTFVDRISDVSQEIRAACQEQLLYIQELQSSWTQGISTLQSFELPEDWKPQTALQDYDDIDPLHNMVGRDVQLWLAPIADRVSYLTREAVVTRHLDAMSTMPDFLLWPRRGHDPSWPSKPSKCFSLDPRVSILAFADVLRYNGTKIGAASAVGSMFTCLPGSWVICDPTFEFPPRLSVAPIPKADLAVALQLIRPSTPQSASRNSSLSIGPLHPALLVGVFGPAQWPGYTAEDHTECDLLLRHLAESVHASLNCHVLNFLHGREGTTASSIKLPRRLVLFAVMYDADCVRLVAHIPYVKPVDDQIIEFRYLSWVVDTLPYLSPTSPSANADTFFIDRFRLAFALLTLRRHVYHLASFWSRVSRPLEILLGITESQDEQDDIVLNESPTPSDAYSSYSSSEWEDEDPTDRVKPTKSEDEEELAGQLEWIAEEAECKRPSLESWARDVGMAKL